MEKGGSSTTLGLFKFKKDMFWIFFGLMVLVSAVVGAGLCTLLGPSGIVVGMVFGGVLGWRYGAFVEKMRWEPF